MNLVELIKDQLSSGLVKELSSHLGASEGATKSAALAAVPALLSGLSGLTSSGTAGAQKLASAIEPFASGSLSGLAHKFANQPSSVLEQGSSILSSLFGGSTISGIVNALSRFAGMAPGVTQKLLGYLTPLIMGAIASRFSGKSINAQGLTSLFAEHKADIASALPSGLSLSEVPGLSATGSAVPSAARGVEATSSSLARWLLPLAGLAALAALLWWFLPSSTTPAPEGVQPAPVIRTQSPDIATKPVTDAAKTLIPDVSQLKTDVTDVFSKLTEALTSVKDVPTASRVPTLKDLDGKLDGAKTKVKDLSTAAKATITTVVKAAELKLKELIEKVMAIPGVGDKLKPVVDAIMTKVAALSE